MIAQDSQNRTYRRKIRNIKAADTLNIQDQYQFLIDNSDSYQEYKVIKLSWMNTIGNHLKDSLKAINTDLENNIDKVAQLEIEKNRLNNQIESLNQEVKDKHSLSFMGIKMKKGSYHTLVWAIIFSLIGILAYYLYKFKNANKVTQNAIAKYDELEEEFNLARTRALEREQALNRKLMDMEKNQ
jgi:hypothetical protein